MAIKKRKSAFKPIQSVAKQQLVTTIIINHHSFCRYSVQCVQDQQQAFMLIIPASTNRHAIIPKVSIHALKLPSRQSCSHSAYPIFILPNCEVNRHSPTSTYRYLRTGRILATELRSRQSSSSSLSQHIISKVAYTLYKHSSDSMMLDNCVLYIMLRYTVIISTPLYTPLYI